MHAPHNTGTSTAAHSLRASHSNGCMLELFWPMADGAHPAQAVAHNRSMRNSHFFLLACVALLPHRSVSSIHPWGREITVSPLGSLLGRSTTISTSGRDLREIDRENNDFAAQGIETCRRSTANFSGAKLAAGRLSGGATGANVTSASAVEGFSQEEDQEAPEENEQPPKDISLELEQSEQQLEEREQLSDESNQILEEGSQPPKENEPTAQKKKSEKEKSVGLFHRFRHDPHSTAKKYSKKLKNRNTLNLGRKMTHASFGIFFGALNQMVPKKLFVEGMVVLTSATLVMELLRYRRGFGWMNDALHFCLGSSLRKHEMEGKFTGSFYYFLGVTATAYCFPKSSATLGMLQLALADPSASYFGRRTRHIYWSRIENGLMGFGRNKGFLGFVGGALFCVPFNCRVLSIAKWGPGGIPGGNSALITASLLLGFAGAFADLAVPTPALCMPDRICGIHFPPFHVDDNFVVPLVSAFACTKIFDYLGWSRDLALSKLLFF